MRLHATVEVSLDHDQANVFLWIHDHQITEGGVVIVRIGPNFITLQHVRAPETLEVMNLHNNQPKLV